MFFYTDPCITMWLEHIIQFILRQNITHICRGLLCFTALVKSQGSWIRSTGMNHKLYILFPVVHMHKTSVSITASYFSVSFTLSFFLPFLSRLLKSCCSGLSTGWNENQKWRLAVWERTWSLHLLCDWVAASGLWDSCKFPVCWR